MLPTLTPGFELIVDSSYSVTEPDGMMSPILSVVPSVNHMLPSGPGVRPLRLRFADGTANSANAIVLGEGAGDAPLGAGTGVTTPETVGPGDGAPLAFGPGDGVPDGAPPADSRESNSCRRHRFRLRIRQAPRQQKNHAKEHGDSRDGDRHSHPITHANRAMARGPFARINWYEGSFRASLT